MSVEVKREAQPTPPIVTISVAEPDEFSTSGLFPERHPVLIAERIRRPGYINFRIERSASELGWRCAVRIEDAEEFARRLLEMIGDA